MRIVDGTQIQTWFNCCHFILNTPITILVNHTTDQDEELSDIRGLSYSQSFLGSTREFTYIYHNQIKVPDFPLGVSPYKKQSLLGLIVQKSVTLRIWLFSHRRTTYYIQTVIKIDRGWIMCLLSVEFWNVDTTHSCTLDPLNLFHRRTS